MAVYANIFLDQGSTFSSLIDVTDSNGDPFDLTGYTARGQLRRSYLSQTAVPFTVSIPVPLTDGKIGISLTAVQTAALKGRYVYDIEIVQTSSGTVTRVIEGQLEVNSGVTRVTS